MNRYKITINRPTIEDEGRWRVSHAPVIQQYGMDIWVAEIMKFIGKNEAVEFVKNIVDTLGDDLLYIVNGVLIIDQEGLEELLTRV